MIIHLISSPRNVSTALMYSFAQRPDTKVVDEPFYASYLKRSGNPHPGAAQIIDHYETDPRKIIQNIQRQDKPGEVLFIKNMAHHLTKPDLKFMKGITNIFFIRDPKEIITSYTRVLADPDMEDIGIRKIHELYSIYGGNRSIVLDSGELLMNPSGLLKKICSLLKIPFFRSMLHWPEGPKPYDGIWSEFWYENVHRSTGFKLQRKTKRALADKYIPLYFQSLPFYKILYNQSIKADESNAAKI